MPETETATPAPPPPQVRKIPPYRAHWHICSTVWGAWHWIFFGSTLLLIGGAALEGYYGGSLNHR